MNLFATDRIPAIAASHLDDVRLRKMLLETAQIICTAAHTLGYPNAPYKPTHKHHPVVRWASDKSKPCQLLYLVRYFNALVIECKRRWPTKTMLVSTKLSYHPMFDWLFAEVFSHDKAPNIYDKFDNITFQNSCETPLKRINFKHINDTCVAYQMYLTAKWLTDVVKPTFTNTTQPSFVAEHFENVLWHLRNSEATLLACNTRFLVRNAGLLGVRLPADWR